MTVPVRGGHARADRFDRPVEEAVHLVASAAALLRVLKWLAPGKIAKDSFGEIFRATQFSSFSTLSAPIADVGT
jgi:hypothetical protein